MDGELSVLVVTALAGLVPFIEIGGIVLAVVAIVEHALTHGRNALPPNPPYRARSHVRPVPPRLTVDHWTHTARWWEGEQ